MGYAISIIQERTRLVNKAAKQGEAKLKILKIIS